MGEIYNCAVEMGSVAMIYLPRFIKIDSGFRKLIRYRDTQDGDRISLFLFLLKLLIPYGHKYHEIKKGFPATAK
jgi:hypothetical protein